MVNTITLILKIAKLAIKNYEIKAIKKAVKMIE